MVQGSNMNVRMEDVVLDAAVAGLGLTAAWGVLVLVAGAHECLRGAAPAALRAVTPAVARRLVALVCGTAIGAVGVAVPAASGTPGHDRGQAAGLGPAAALTGLPLPERAAGPRTGHSTDGTPASVVVRRGDSLWSLAQARLSPGAPLAHVDEAWRALYAANRARVGPDPDLLLPGTVLRLPSRQPLHHQGAPDVRAHDSRKERP
jgi:nucleoid-associated protein YgaU